MASDLNPVPGTGRNNNIDRDRTLIRRRAVGTFPDRRSAEEALHELRRSGYPMDQISVIARDADRHGEIAGVDVRDRADDKTHAGNKADDGAKVGALSGGALGGLTGLLVGIGALAIPGVGPVMLAGAAATALATTAAGGVIGAAAGSLLGGLIGLGIPEERAKVYNDRVSSGQYLVVVDGTEQEVTRAATLLSRRNIQDWGVFDIPEAERVNRANTVRSDVAAAPVAAAPVAPPVNRANTVRSDVAATPTAPVVPPIAPAAPVVPVAPAASNRIPAPPAGASEQDIKLYEERLVADKMRQKTGEIAIGKHVESETVHVSVPIEKERVVVERVAPSSPGEIVGDAAFRDGETVRMEVYEETPDIHKETFVREEVDIRKERVQESVSAEETLRRERLDVNTQGNPVVKSDRLKDERI